MPGLLSRALRIRPGPRKPVSGTAESDIPAEERSALLAEIENVVARSRVPLDSAAKMVFPAPRQELLLPVLVNAAAVVVICAAALVLPAVLRPPGQATTQGEGAALAGESTLVGTLRKESEQTVRKIQSTLQAAIKARDELAAGAQTLVQRRQQELAASMAAELATEKARLQQEGASDAAVERRMRTLEQQKRAELERQVSDYQRQVEAQLAQKDAEISALQAESRKNREEGGRLAALQARSRDEQLVLDQLTASYARVADAMKAGRLSDAAAGLAALRSYIDQPAVASLPGIQKRRTVDLFLIESLGKLAQPAPAAAPPADAQAESARRAAVAAAVSEAISAGNALYARGSYRESVARYGQALEALKDAAPGVDTLAGRIAEAGFRQGLADLAARQEGPAKAAFDQAQSKAAQGAYLEAVSGYASLILAYPDSSYVEKAADAIRAAAAAVQEQNARAAARQAQVQQLNAAAREELGTLRQSLSEAARKSSASAAAAQEELISLLRTKVDVREVLLSDAVRAAHPDLSQKLDRFLNLTAEMRRAEGRAAAMKDAADVIQAVAAGSPAPGLESVVGHYREEPGRAAFQKFLDSLRALFP